MFPLMLKASLLQAAKPNNVNNFICRLSGKKMHAPIPQTNLIENWGI